ncbi:MAG: O-antigen ligase family protein [Acidobacteria bacterium]|nr:O-antigen ligase family protein [Acidobacteriota bacterium]
MTQAISISDSRLSFGNYFEKTSTFFLYCCALAAPHTIAGSQGSFLAAAFFWLISCLLKKEFSIKRTPLDFPLLGLFAWASLSACFSYERMTSFSGLKQLAFFSLFYFVATRACDGQRARRLALVLICSCSINVCYSIYQKIKGEGLRIDKIYEGSLINRRTNIIFVEGDVLLRADGKAITSLQVLSDAVDNGPADSMVKVDFRHNELLLTGEILRRRFQKQEKLVGVERFAIEVSPARDFRSQGFYNHYSTYAEVLQLITSLVFGFLLASPRKVNWLLFFGLFALAFTTTLVFTATRAPLAALGLSAFIITIFSQGQRRLILIALLLVILPVGAYAIAKWRGVGLIDLKDGSTTWRLEIWQEGLNLVKKHPILGIGKGSERKHWKEWGMFRNGELPPGHFHSTFLQIAVWWGIPALLLYLAVIGQMIKTFANFLLTVKADALNWQQRAIILGALGGLVGFSFSSLVHFNFGDGEVVIVFWLILGLAMAEILSIKNNKSAEMVE